MRVLNLLDVFYKRAHAISSSCELAVPTSAESDYTSDLVAASSIPYPDSVVGFS